MITISRRCFFVLASIPLIHPFLSVTTSESSDDKVDSSLFPITISVLKLAYVSEKTAAEKYVGYSQKAVEEQFPNIAYLFSAMAASEHIHAENYKRILHTLNASADKPASRIAPTDTKSNMINAADSELTKIKQTYPDFLAKLEPEEHEQAIASCTYSWKSHKQHQAQIMEIKKYSKLFFGPVAKEIEESDFDFHVCQNCGSTLDEAPGSAYVICGQPPSNYRKIARPA